jgi:ElaA protein
MSFPGPLDWADLDAAVLDTRTLYDVLVLRAAVFVVEQQCAYADPDGVDLEPGTRHLLGRSDGRLAAYARILPPDSAHRTPRIGRVVVAEEERGGGLGRQLVERALASCREHHPGRAVEMGAQTYLTGFYRSLGFTEVGEPYVEDGIPHVWMRRQPD